MYLILKTDSDGFFLTTCSYVSWPLLHKPETQLCPEQQNRLNTWKSNAGPRSRRANTKVSKGMPPSADGRGSAQLFPHLQIQPHSLCSLAPGPCDDSGSIQVASLVPIFPSAS